MDEGLMRLKLKDMVFSCLKDNPEVQFTSRQIAHMLIEKYPEQAEIKIKNSSENIKTELDLVDQFQAEIGSRRPTWQNQHPQFKTTSGRPRKYYWTEESDQLAVDLSDLLDEAEPAVVIKSARSENKKYNEASMYPLLSEYLLAESNVFSMRIDEKASSNKNGSGANEWLHPDIVGIEDLSAGWVELVKNCAGQLSERRARFWSFEVKLLVNRSNVRKAYFQTVSNSSWSHFGYLVAATVEGEDTMRELRMLSATHGIGVIQLDVDAPSESQILIPARERTTIDWEMCNRLAEENRDFASYLQKIVDFSLLGRIKPAEWNF